MEVLPVVMRSMLRFDEPALADHEVPVVEAHGAHDGPTLTLLAGVHGCEYTSMAALRTFMREIDETALHGRVRALLVASVAAFRERSPFVSPVDGRNLNRCFPGDAQGSYSEQLAHAITTRFITGSDALVDLHAGDLVEALTPFTIHEEAAVAGRSAAMAEAYALPFAILQPSADRAVSGSTTGAAADLGIPSIIAEAGGCGLVEAHAVEAHLHGLRRLAAHLGMLARPPLPKPPAVRRMTRFVWLRSGVDGWWQPSVAVGADVAEGEELGVVLDPFGDELERVTAPATGVPVFMTSSPAVVGGGLLLGLAAGELR